MKEEKNSTHTKKINRDEQLEKTLLSRLNRIEGQIRGINKMVQNNIYCDDILAQVSSVQSSLSSFSRLLLENHINTCISDRIKDDDQKAIEELMKTISKLR